MITCEEIKAIYPNCTECSHGSKIVVKENKKEYILQNPSGRKVCKVKIDGCVIPSQDRSKCDFMLIVCSTKDVYLIELKGRDLLHAVAQLRQTLEDFQSEITGKVFARIVLSKVASPKVVEVDPSVVKLRKVLNQYKGNLVYASRVYDKDNVDYQF